MDLNKFLKSKVWWPEGQGHKIEDEELVIIQKEILKFPKCRMLQIGTNYGWTMWNVLKQLNQVHGSIDTIDLAKARKPKLSSRTDKWINHVSSVLENHDLGGLIRYFINGSNDFFEHHCDTTYHIIFIDGDHARKQSETDLKNSVEVLRERGTIFMHDMRNSVYLTKKNCYKTFKEFEHPQFTKTLINTKYGLGILRWNNLGSS